MAPVNAANPIIPYAEYLLVHVLQKEYRVAVPGLFMIKSHVLNLRSGLIGWIGVFLLFAGIVCQIRMARLKQIGTDSRYNPKENTPAELQAALDHSFEYYTRYSAVRPYRNGLLLAGSVLVIVCLSLPTIRTRTKRQVLTITGVSAGTLYGAAISASFGEIEIIVPLCFGAASWWLVQKFVKFLRWSRPKVIPTLPENKDQDTEFARHREAGGMQGMIIAAWAKFSKLDGRVSREELSVLERWMKAMRFTQEGRLRAIETFNDAKSGPTSFWEAAVELTGWNTESFRPLRCIFIFGLLDLAHAHGEISARSADLLEDVCELYEVPFKKWTGDYQKLRTLPHGIEEFVAGLLGLGREETYSNIPNSQNTDAPYSTLGCRPTDSDETIRDCYRRLARALHPDALATKDLSPELLQIAEEKFKTIQAAYEVIRQTRKNVGPEHAHSV